MPPSIFSGKAQSAQPNSLLVFTFGLVGAALYAFADRAQLFAPLNPKMMPKEDKATKLFGINYVAATTVASATLVAGVAVRSPPDSVFLLRERERELLSNSRCSLF